MDIARRRAQRRRFNERLAQYPADDYGGEAVAYLCECSLIGCDRAIKLTGDEYDHLRSHPNRFAVLAEHTIAEAEQVLAGRRGWLIVEPLGAAEADRPAEPAPAAVRSL